MDVYIKNAGKPQNCETCNLADCHNIFMFCGVDRAPLFPEHFNGDGREDYPLIAIKKGHGNLVDVDSLIKKLKDLDGAIGSNTDGQTPKTILEIIELVKLEPILVEKEEVDE